MPYCIFVMSVLRSHEGTESYQIIKRLVAEGFELAACDSLSAPYLGSPLLDTKSAQASKTYLCVMHM
jgi:hypothetical protein